VGRRAAQRPTPPYPRPPRFAERAGRSTSALEPLSAVEVKLEHSRLAREDTLCRESMPAAERRWLTSNRSPLAQHWNLLTGLTVDQLSYAT
jgi:hypothetical protein